MSEHVLPRTVTHHDVTVRHDRGADGTTVTIAGELDVGSAPWIFEQIVVAGGWSQGQVLLALDEVTFIDSSGLRSLRLARECLGADRFRVSTTSRPVRRLLEISGLTELLG